LGLQIPSLKFAIREGEKKKLMNPVSSTEFHPEKLLTAFFVEL
jgi:hypothetical protein